MSSACSSEATCRRARKSNAARKRGCASVRITRLRGRGPDCADDSRDCSSQISCIGSEKRRGRAMVDNWCTVTRSRSEEHTSELQSLMRISYAVFCLKIKNYTKKKQIRQTHDQTTKQNNKTE